MPLSSSAALALVVVLNSAGGSVEQTAAILPESACLAAMRAVWAIPAETVAAPDVPAVDAYCTAPDKAPHLQAFQMASHMPAPND